VNLLKKSLELFQHNKDGGCLVKGLKGAKLTRGDSVDPFKKYPSLSPSQGERDKG